MKFVIVTGMSGAGKSTAMKMMEDMGYFCIDNLPIQLLDKLIDFSNTFHSDVSKVAVGIDVRNGSGRKIFRRRYFSSMLRMRCL